MYDSFSFFLWQATYFEIKYSNAHNFWVLYILITIIDSQQNITDYSNIIVIDYWLFTFIIVYFYVVWLHAFIKLTSMSFVRYKPQQFNQPMCSSGLECEVKSDGFCLCVLYTLELLHMFYWFLSNEFGNRTCVHTSFSKHLCRWVSSDYSLKLYETN